MILSGRRKITTEFRTEDLLDANNVISLLNNTMLTHIQNKTEIDYLVNYKNGKQPILDKVKDVRPEINNMLVLNHAQMATRMITGYFLGTPIQYIHNSGKYKTEIDELNKYLSYEDKASVDKEIGEYQSITGTAYRFIYTDGTLKDEVPFEQVSLNPSTTYVVYENTIASTPVCGVTFHSTKIGNYDAFKIYVYTRFGYYVILTYDLGVINKNSTIQDLVPYNLGGVPIIEYPNNQWRLGDWELVIPLMDAINTLYSGRLDDIEQVIESLIVFFNADIDSERYAEMREAGVIMLNSHSTSGSTGTDVKTIVSKLDQTGMSLLAKELESLLYGIVGIPDRNNRVGGGSDTGAAVELRDGWADLETVVRNKELSFKRSEKMALVVMLSILKNKLGFGLSLIDIDIKFSRNKNNNMLVKTQSYQTLLSTKTLDPSDCLMICDLVSDEEAFISRGKLFWEDNFANKIETKEEQPAILPQNEPNVNNNLQIED